MILHGVETGTGPAVALLHGLFGQAANFGTLRRRLSATHRVIALDLRNHGASGHSPAMTYPAMAEDVLETLRDRKALPCALVGHSMGGKVAMMAALEAPAAVARLLVLDIAPVRYPPAYRDMAAAMAAIPLHPTLTRAEADAALATAAPPTCAPSCCRTCTLAQPRAGKSTSPPSPPPCPFLKTGRNATCSPTPAPPSSSPANARTTSAPTTAPPSAPCSPPPASSP